MTAGLSSPSGSYMEAVVASAFRFVLAVESVVCTCVMLCNVDPCLDSIVIQVLLFHLNYPEIMSVVFLAAPLELYPRMQSGLRPTFSM